MLQYFFDHNSAPFLGGAQIDGLFGEDEVLFQGVHVERLPYHGRTLALYESGKRQVLGVDTVEIGQGFFRIFVGFPESFGLFPQLVQFFFFRLRKIVHALFDIFMRRCQSFLFQFDPGDLIHFLVVIGLSFATFRRQPRLAFAVGLGSFGRVLSLLVSSDQFRVIESFAANIAPKTSALGAGTRAWDGAGGTSHSQVSRLLFPGGRVNGFRVFSDIRLSRRFIRAAGRGTREFPIGGG